jgi:hypothetical protein
MNERVLIKLIFRKLSKSGEDYNSRILEQRKEQINEFSAEKSIKNGIQKFFYGFRE